MTLVKRLAQPFLNEYCQECILCGVENLFYKSETRLKRLLLIYYIGLV